MLTNIVASVTIFLTTNTVDVFPQRLVHGPYLETTNSEYKSDAVFYSHYEPIKNPSEKWVKTRVEKQTELAFVWQGQYWSVTNTVQLTNWTLHFEKSEDWKLTITNVPLPFIQ